MNMNMNIRFLNELNICKVDKYALIVDRFFSRLLNIISLNLLHLKLYQTNLQHFLITFGKKMPIQCKINIFFNKD